PVIIPVAITSQDLQELFKRLNGLLLTGGGDINPDRFNGAPHPRVYDIDERRDEQEIDLVRLAAENGKPFLGICRGIQVINVAFGGTLFTDILDQMPGGFKHDYYPDSPRDYLAHPVSVTPGSMLAKILDGETFDVNSLHHQGTDRVAPQLSPVASSSDNLVEAVELQGHPFGLGVQWHPEWLQAYEPQRQLFRAFINAALGK
ncbi:MAG: gamma-glutamyl-gamma-aminobutyrate hydrolase family protein, partial [Anaerolineaceae bacterium]|nr:gamma-glutamyl-gamma-aminobutyrate hydrolase family protein [Anaerolineaceae bacterium]